MLETLRTILVTTDFSETSEGALQSALGVARRYGASVTVLHVYSVPVYSFPDGVYIAPADLATNLSAASQRGLDALMARLDTPGGPGVPITAILREGRAEEEIPAVAKEIGAGLIVVGTHARKGLSRALLGSVAETVIRTCDIPVLVVHPQITT